MGRRRSSGGESGPRARPCDVRWIESLLDQGQAAGVPVFVKQLGACPVDYQWDQWGLRPHAIDCRCGFHDGFSHPKGGDWAEWPEDLRVREVPQWPA